MTKIDSIKVKKRVILPAVIITAVVIIGVFLTNPITSFVTAIQSSNMTVNEREGGIFIQDVALQFHALQCFCWVSVLIYRFPDLA